MIPETNMLYIYAKNQFEITGVAVPGGGKPPFQRGGQPAAGSADANGGAFGGVASLKGPVRTRPRLDRARRPGRSHRAGT